MLHRENNWRLQIGNNNYHNCYNYYIINKIFIYNKIKPINIYIAQINLLALSAAKRLKSKSPFMKIKSLGLKNNDY